MASVIGDLRAVIASAEQSRRARSTTAAVNIGVTISIIGARVQVTSGRVKIASPSAPNSGSRMKLRALARAMRAMSPM